MKRGPGFKDETGNVYTRLRVLEFDKYKNDRAFWKCLCDPELGGCGKVLPVRGTDLRNGHSKSCGCLRREAASKNMKSKTGEKNHMYGRYGRDNPNYNPNLTPENRVDRRHIPGYKEWVKEVYKLDNYTCQKCGHSGSNLNAHHIEGYNSNQHLRIEVSNGITLCEDCHKDFHHRYGRCSNTRAQLIEFLRSL